MILPIVAYGDPVLKKKGLEIDAQFPDLKKIIEDMFETMYAAKGVGLAAPQIGKSIRLFIVDAKPFAKDDEYKGQDLSNFKKVFINPTIQEESGEKWIFNEGCLSIPDVRWDVERMPNIRIHYFDEQFIEKVEALSGIVARVIQHEYDHIEGKLFLDRISPLQKRMFEKRLLQISKGEVDVDYKMKFPIRPRKR